MWRAVSIAVATGLSALPALADERAAGEALYPERCGACHALAESEKPFQGPRLDRLSSRTAGSLEGFDFSLAMEKAGKAGLIWQAERLDAYLVNPQAVAPGTFMAQPKLTDDERRALIAFLLAPR